MLLGTLQLINKALLTPCSSYHEDLKSRLLCWWYCNSCLAYWVILRGRNDRNSYPKSLQRLAWEAKWHVDHNHAELSNERGKEKTWSCNGSQHVCTWVCSGLPLVYDCGECQESVESLINVSTAHNWQQLNSSSPVCLWQGDCQPSESGRTALW